jgi:thioredoxin 1
MGTLWAGVDVGKTHHHVCVVDDDGTVVLSEKIPNVALTQENFERVVAADGIVLVDFWAAWCGPCRAFAPVLERASGKHADVVFGKIDTEAQPELAGAARITSIPTLMAFRDGVLVFSQPGALPAAALEQVIEAVRDLDMDDVGATIAEQSSSANR